MNKQLIFICFLIFQSFIIVNSKIEKDHSFDLNPFLPKSNGECKIGNYNFIGFHNRNSSYEYKVGDLTYHWNICSEKANLHHTVSKCNNNNIALCSIDSDYNSIIYGEHAHHTISKLSDGKLGGLITYSTDNGNFDKNSKCTTSIKMYCAKGMPNTVVSLNKVEGTICSIEINMLGESACPYDIKNSYLIDKQVAITVIVISVFLCVLTIVAITLTILYIIDRKKKSNMKSSSSASYTRLLNVTPGGEDQMDNSNIQWN